MWGQRSCRGHRGQKGHFHQKCYFSYRLLGMVLWLTHIHQLNTPYKSYQLKFRFGVIWGHRGQKVIFTKNDISTDYIVWSCDSCIFIYISLIPSIYIVRLKVNLGSFGGNRGQKVIFTKNAITCSYYIAWPQNWYMCISLRPFTYFVGSKVNLGSFGSQGLKYYFCLKCYNSPI